MIIIYDITHTHTHTHLIESILSHPWRCGSGRGEGEEVGGERERQRISSGLKRQSETCILCKSLARTHARTHAHPSPPPLSLSLIHTSLPHTPHPRLAASVFTSAKRPLRGRGRRWGCRKIERAILSDKTKVRSFSSFGKESDAEESGSSRMASRMWSIYLNLEKMGNFLS